MKIPGRSRGRVRWFEGYPPPGRHYPLDQVKQASYDVALKEVEGTKTPVVHEEILD